MMLPGTQFQGEWGCFLYRGRLALIQAQCLASHLARSGRGELEIESEMSEVWVVEGWASREWTANAYRSISPSGRVGTRDL